MVVIFTPPRPWAVEYWGSVGRLALAARESDKRKVTGTGKKKSEFQIAVEFGRRSPLMTLIPLLAAPLGGCILSWMHN